MKKKKLSLGLGLAALFLGVVTLSGCTASFCSNTDQARMLYANDPGVCHYYKAEDIPSGTAVKPLDGFADVYYNVSFENSSTLKDAITKAKEQKIIVPDIDNENSLIFFEELDSIVLDKAYTLAQDKTKDYNNLCKVLHTYGYVKYFMDVQGDESVVLWNNFDAVWNEAATTVANTYGIDYVPSTDFKAYYKTTLNQAINANRSCLTTTEGDYGAYGPNKESVIIEAKDYGSSWSKGLFEGLLVWPLGAFIDTLATGMGYNVSTNTPSNGVPQLLAILVVTVIIRLVMVLATYKQTMGNAKMTELQPEISKIQAKYPNANTNKYEKQRMAEEMQKVYKKNKINPFTTIIVLIIQFPVFICVWGALSGSAVLTNGQFLGLRLGESISSVLFNTVNWTAAGNYGAVTALFLFILMGVAQTVAMLLPQWMQKAKAKKVAKLGKNPAQQSQNNKMKWVTYIMLIMIIIMGFSLVSAMGVYWLVGALFSIAQTLVTQKITEIKSRKKKE